MATWLDGSEYAPTARPDVFVDPQAPELEVVNAVTSVAESPVARPVYEPISDAPQLTSFSPPAPPMRDPKEAFGVIETSLTATSAWGAAHSGSNYTKAGGSATAWTPEQPLSTTVAPIAAYIPPQRVVDPLAQINPDQFVAWVPPTPQQPRSVVTPKLLLSVITPPVLIALLLGGVIHTLSPLMLILGFLLATRIRYRQNAVRTVFTLSAVLAAIGGIFVYLRGYGYRYAFYAVADISQTCCWIIGAVLVLICYLALSKNESPRK